MAKRSSTRAVFQAIEQLEGRQMMSVVDRGNPFDFRDIPAVTPTSTKLQNYKDGPFVKGGAALGMLFNDFRTYTRAGKEPESYTLPTTSKDLLTSGNRVGVTVRTKGSVDALITDLRSYGAQILFKNKKTRTVDAFVPFQSLLGLVQNSKIAQAHAIAAPQNNVVNQADLAQAATFVRAGLNVDGTGQTIGVLSDSVNQSGSGLRESVQNGDLPANPNFDADRPANTTTNNPSTVKVIADYPGGSDEGRAMLGLAHDIAPGAGLQFATAFLSQQGFADNIRALRDAGSTVIVDDVSYFDEPFFQDGLISGAVTEVTEDNVVYASSVANSGPAGYQRTAQWYDDPTSGETLIDFNADPKRVDTSMDVTFKYFSSLVFQWDNPYDGVTGKVTSDIDLRLVDADGNVVAQSTDDNFGTGVPVERLFAPPGDYQLQIVLVSTAPGASRPTIYKFKALDNGQNTFDGNTDVEYPGEVTSSAGHNNGADTLSVGAVDFNSTNAFGAVPDTKNEDFSAYGNATYTFYQNGTRREKNLHLLKPDVSGIDAASTGVEGFLPFFGTSAAAPDVAAVAALLRQISPTSTSVEIKQAIIDGAKFTPLNGSTSGEHDRQGGYGLVDATRSAQILSPGSPFGRFTALEQNPKSNGLGSLLITFTEPVTGVDIGDFTLTRDGTAATRFKGGETLTQIDSTTYRIDNLRADTKPEGTYYIRLKNAGTGITDSSANVVPGAIYSFVSFVPPPRPPTDVTAEAVNTTSIRIEWKDGSDNETGFRVERSSDPLFKNNLRVYTVGANVTTFTDTGLNQGVRFYYRVRAFDARPKYSTYSNVDSSFTLSPGEIVIDNITNDSTGKATIRGNWTVEQAVDGTFGDDYLTDGNSGKGRTKDVTYTPNLTKKGEYYVYTRWTANAANATNAPIDVYSFNKKLQPIQTTLLVNQRKLSPGWILLGKFDFEDLTLARVVARNTGTDGRVVTDAIRFLPADNIPAGTAPDAVPDE